ncbi:thiopurine S-methyltransferase [Candidatus Nitrospira nitrificans]|uniref:Thiopurine S-methyltransferase n=1 Tax=Candidatus Nitrospira nitrificans TaxID=1742973 RepID=A0A0S4L8S1_9BACT|nr:thiopurine S-methyltransferase [Candidatus Nitrospira nitrificans]CUS33909.1 Thiopurine S-methyltransferase [Candidatus Nitrospira nitrificans]
MEASFWHNRWQTNQTGWHECVVNPLLITHFPSLNVPQGARVFVPLCGKSLDLSWLLSRGYTVAGAELSELAVTQLFAQLRMEPTISEVRTHKLFSGEKIDIYVGDFFELSREVLGPVDAVYDRAALVALPETMRLRYTAHLKSLTALAPQLVIGYEYDQTVVPGPPFSVTADELHRHYNDSYNLTPLARIEVPGGLKGKCPATEHTWRLNKRPGSFLGGQGCLC